MKILLINPPHHDRKSTSLSNEPLALETIAGTVPDHDVRILDMRFDPQPLVRHLRDFDPDLAGITCFTVDLKKVLAILAQIKEFRSDIITVAGGQHPTLAPHDFISSNLDILVSGPGEIPFQELIRALSKGENPDNVPGIGILSGKTINYTRSNPISDCLNNPIVPARHLTAKYRKNYRFLGSPIALVNTARGCPYRCNFCSIWKVMHGKYITRSPEEIINELKTVQEPLVRFADGNTFGDASRMEKLAGLIEKNGIRKTYFCDMRSDTVIKHTELIRQWKRLGLRYVAMGLEAVTDTRLADLNKANTVKNNIEAINILRDAGVTVLGQFIVMQDFTEDDFDNMSSFILKHDIQLANFTIATPYPGTEFHEKEKHRLITGDYTYFDSHHNVLPTAMKPDIFLKKYTDLFRKTYSFRRFLNRKIGRVAGSPSSMKSDRLGLIHLAAIRTILRGKLKHLEQPVPTAS